MALIDELFREGRMSAAELLTMLTLHGYRLTRAGDALRLQGPKSALTEDMRQAIRQHKAALMTLLTAQETPQAAAAAPQPAVAAAALARPARRAHRYGRRRRRTHRAPGICGRDAPRLGGDTRQARTRYRPAALPAVSVCRIRLSL